MTDTGPRFAEVFAELSSAEGLSQDTVRRVFEAIFAGAWTPTRIAGFLVALRVTRNETAPVIAAAAKAMRAVMVRVEHSHETLLDTCGTGGDGAGTLNLSTGAAVVAAAAGVAVAKHGNRAASSRSGSADVLEALGVAIDVPAPLQGDVLREANIAFLFAQAHHPAMRHVGAARAELGIRTLFNLLGPLANPAGATHQLVGVADDSMRPLLAEALRELGTKRAWLVRSEDGLDELSPHGRTRVTEVSAGKISEFSVSPEDFGFSRSPAGAIAGAEPASNARALEQILTGQAHPAADAVLLNAAAALVVALELDFKVAADRARDAIHSGQAQATLGRLRAATAARRPPSPKTS